MDWELWNGLEEVFAEIAARRAPSDEPPTNIIRFPVAYQYHNEPPPKQSWWQRLWRTK